MRRHLFINRTSLDGQNVRFIFVITVLFLHPVGGWGIARIYIVMYRVQMCCACHTPSIAFRHLPPNSARFGYATEGALFISAQLSTDAVSALRKVWVLVRLWKQPSAQAARKHQTHPPWVQKEFRLDSDDCAFICSGVNFVGGYN